MRSVQVRRKRIVVGAIDAGKTLGARAGGEGKTAKKDSPKHQTIRTTGTVHCSYLPLLFFGNYGMATIASASGIT
jgi:hypothetical protein